MTMGAELRPGKRTRVNFQNVGCKLNQHEIEAMRNGFDRRGYDVAATGEEADICVVNTCTVTGSGDADSRKAVRRARRSHPNATVVATGCYAERRPGELAESGAHLVLGNDRKADLIDCVEALLAGDPIPAPTGTRFLEIEGSVKGGRTRGTLKIQDGCDEHCTYCIIPAVRGDGVSRPPDDVVRQAEMMVEAGYRELALTGVHTGSYGYDSGDECALVSMLRRLDEIDGLDRIRLNSIEPGFVDDALIAHAAASSKFCRHFHVPLQSGDDVILKRMGRRYRRSDYRALIRRLYDAIPDCSLGADVMVGFPGEEERHFANSYELLDELPMSYLHVFTYSLRADTPAERLPGHVSRHTATHRARTLIELGSRKREAFNQRLVGRRVTPLLEDRRDRASGLQVGLTDNYVKVAVDMDGMSAAPGDIIDVSVTQAREDQVFGHMLRAA